jgi:SAM-dependent methyltransferase
MSIILKVYDPKAVEADPRQYWTQQMAATYFRQPTGFIEAVKQSTLYAFLTQYLPQQGCFLDGGCGSNYLAALLARDDRRIIGLDFAVDNLRHGQTLFPSVPSVAGDLNCLPFPATTFDGVLSISTAEHLETGPRRLFEETWRVLRKDGIFLLLIPTYNVEDSLVACWQRLFKRPNGALQDIPHRFGVKHYKVVTEFSVDHHKGFFAYWCHPRTIRRMLLDAGFTIEQAFFLGVMEGLLRSRILKRWIKPIVLQEMRQQIRRTFSPDVAADCSWFEKVFIREDVYNSRGNFFTLQCVGRFYRYLAAFVCRKL